MPGSDIGGLRTVHFLFRLHESSVARRPVVCQATVEAGLGAGRSSGAVTRPRGRPRSATRKVAAMTAAMQLKTVSVEWANASCTSCTSREGRAARPLK